MSESRTPLIPVLPLRDIVVFPHMIVPLFVGRLKSVNALEEVMQDDKQILLATQINKDQDDPKTGEIYKIGTVGTILQMLKLPDNTVKVLVEGIYRARVLEYVDSENFYQARIEPLKDDIQDPNEVDALGRAVAGQFENYVKLNKKIPPEVLVSINQIDGSSKLADSIASHLPVKNAETQFGLKISEKQDLLETLDVAKRLEKVFGFMEAEIGVLQMDKKIRTRVKKQMEKTQREYYLNEQLKAIQKELGEGEDGTNEIQELEVKIKKTRLSKEAREKCNAELKKLKTMSPMSAEATVVRNYLDWMLTIPWKRPSKIKSNLKDAKKVLDADHYGLEKVKERIIEHLAVQTRIKKIRGPILCLVGPPGVGKTSLGKSMANATGRHFVRMSLGGVRDEAEIRGHRRTYIGSMPGKIIQGMKKAKASNPLFLLDEIDKMGSDWRGDPAAALLEVLDPEQNSSFNDHYLEVDYDLSDVMFVTTANTLRMAQPLLDRMEIIRLPGYTEQEKLEIARQHLIPKAIADHGLKDGEIEIADSAVIDLIRYYTREAGVRNLERELMNMARKAVKEIMMREGDSDKDKKVVISSENIDKFAGVKKFKFGEAELEDQIGLTTGLAWTEVGGELLQIEAVVVPGKGKMQITGKLGDVMQESVQAAASYVRSRATAFGIKPPMFEKRDIHIHVPEGATPKDGPSAGIAMCTSIVSVLSGIPVRKDIAMTGEITLRGRVLAIGGLKEKLLAALRGGIKTVLIPEENEKDLAEIPDVVKDSLKIIPVSTADEVLKLALVRLPTAIEWPEDVIEPTPPKKPETAAVSDDGGVIAH